MTQNINEQNESYEDLYFLVDKKFFHCLAISLMQTSMMQSNAKSQS